MQPGSDDRAQRGFLSIEDRSAGRGRSLAVVVLVTLVMLASVPTTAVGQPCDDVANVGVDVEPHAVTAGSAVGSTAVTGVDGGGPAHVDGDRYRQVQDCPTETAPPPDGEGTTGADGTEDGAEAAGTDGGDGATPRAPDGRVLLDGQPTELETVTVQGSTYGVYRVDNALPYASGIEVYVDGERVPDAAAARPGLSVVAAERALRAEGIERPSKTARRVVSNGGDLGDTFQRIAWEQAVAELGPSDIETLQNIRSTASDIDSTLSPTASALDSTVRFIDGLKQQQVLGQSVWDLATTASPSLQGFERTVRTLRDEVVAWQTAARSVDQNVQPVVESLQRMERGESVDYDALSSRFQNAMTALDALQSQSDQLQSRLSDAASTSASIGSSVGDVPVVGGQIAGHFNGLADRLSGAANDVASFSSTLESQRSSLQAVQSSADDTRTSLQSTYERELASLEGSLSGRNSAPLKVYGTGGVGVSIAAIGAWRLFG